MIFNLTNSLQLRIKIIENIDASINKHLKSLHHVNRKFLKTNRMINDIQHVKLQIAFTYT